MRCIQWSKESISITRTPNKRLNYVQGDRLNLDGMILGLTYNSGEVENLPEFKGGNIPEGVEVTGYNPQQLGNQAITISYGGKSMQFSIRVLPGPTGTAEKNLIQPRVSIENKMDGTKGGYKLVTLSCPDGASDIPTGTIYYTTNGDTPTNRSTPYNENEPIRVEETTTIKAIAINGSDKSPVTSALVSLPQVSAPIVANLHHRNNQGLNRSMTELEPGTLVSLISDTSGATIFYWIEGKLGSAEDSRYGTSIYMKPEYADAQGNVVLKAYAAKDGYQNSTVTTMRYHLNIQETPFETATVSVGNVSSRAGELVSPTLNINTTDEGKLTNFHVKIAYDSGVLSFVSVNPLQSGTQVFSANSTSGRNGEVTVQYNGTTPLEAGEVCTLNFRALDSSEDQRYDLTIDQEEITINTDTNSPMVYDFMDGWVTLLGSHNSQLTATTDIVAADGSEIDNIGNLEAGTEVQARVTIDLPTISASGDAALQAAEDQLRVLNVFVAIYDGNDAMVNLETWDIDVTDPTNLQTVRRLRINRSVTGGRVRFMLMSDTMVPAAASNLLSASAH